MTALLPSGSGNQSPRNIKHGVGRWAAPAAAAGVAGLILAGCGSTTPIIGTTPTAAAATGASPSSAPGTSGYAGGSVIDETIGGDRYRFQVLKSTSGTAADVESFARQAEPAGLNQGIAGQPSGGGPNYIAVLISITNTGKAAVPAAGEETVSSGNEFPLVAVADPSVVGVGTPGPTGLSCPAAANGPPDFSADNSGEVCAEPYNTMDGPWGASNSLPTQLAPAATVQTLVVYDLPSGISVSNVHLAVNVESFFGITARWADSVPITGTAATVTVTASPPSA